MPRRLKKLPRGLILRVAITWSIPYVLFNQTATNEIFLEGGVEVQLLKTMKEKYGFVYHLERPADKEWGRYLNNSWTGLIGMINRKEADIAVGCLSLTYQRSLACDFTIPYDMDHAAIVTRIPKEKSKDYAALMPFTFQVWVAILLTLLGSICTLFLVMKVQTLWFQGRQPNLCRTFWVLLGHLCSEGGQMKFYQNTLARLVIGLWLMLVLIIQSCYSGTIMSFLTFPGKEVPIRTLEDLAHAIKRQGFKCGCVPGTSYDEILKGLEGELSIIPKTIFEDPSGHVPSVTEAFKRVAHGKYAFIASEVALEYLTYKMKYFDVYISDQARGFDFIAMAVRTDFPYKHGLNYVLRRAFETGLFQKWKRDETPSVVKGLNQNESEMKPLSVEEIKGILIFTGYGYALSILVLIAELIYKRFVRFPRN